MRFTYDLSPGQSERIIEQAIRHHAEVILAPRAWTDDGGLDARLCGREGELLILECPLSQDGTTDTLIGVHIDAQMVLGGTLYLFDTHLVDVDHAEPGTLLLIATPAVLQVAQRRRFQRRTLMSKCNVRLTGGRDDEQWASTGRLLNLSGDGMACRIDEATAKRLKTGDTLHVQFHPAEADTPFEFSSAVTNLSEAGSEGFALLGLQFQLSPEDVISQESRKRLCDMLYARLVAASMVEGGY